MKNLLNRLFGLKVPKQDSSSKITFEACAQCGHDFNTHLLKGYGNPPTEGWMECPVEGCKCEKTWSMDAESKASVERYLINKQGNSSEEKT
jgi:hypothetical protein